MSEIIDPNMDALEAEARAAMDSMSMEPPKSVSEPDVPVISQISQTATAAVAPTAAAAAVSSVTESKYGPAPPAPAPVQQHSYKLPWPQGVQPGAKPVTTQFPPGRGPWNGAGAPAPKPASATALPLSLPIGILNGRAPAVGVSNVRTPAAVTVPLVKTSPIVNTPIKPAAVAAVVVSHPTIAAQPTVNAPVKPAAAAVAVAHPAIAAQSTASRIVPSPVAPVISSRNHPTAKPATAPAPTPTIATISQKPAVAIAAAAAKTTPASKTAAPADGSVDVKSYEPKTVATPVSETPPSLEDLAIPTTMDSEFLARVMEIFIAPAHDLNWTNLIKKVITIKESVLNGDVLRTLIAPRIALCKEIVAKDQYHSNAAYLAFLLYLHEKLIEIHFTGSSVTVRFNGQGELSIPPVRQYILHSGNKKFPWDVCPDNKVQETLSEAVTFVISPILDLVMNEKLPKLGKKGKIWKKMKGFPNVPIGLEGIIDPEEKRVQKDFKTKQPILQVNAEGKPLIHRPRATISIYVPYRSLLWVSVQASSMIEVQKLSIPNIGIHAQAAVAGSNAGGKPQPKSVGSTVVVTAASSDSTENGNGNGKTKTATKHRHHRRHRSRTPSPEGSESESASGSTDEDKQKSSRTARKTKTSKSHTKKEKNADGGGGAGNVTNSDNSGGFMNQLRNLVRR
jgi:hypothetical protein